MCFIDIFNIFQQKIKLGNGYWTDDKGLSEESIFRGTVPLPLGKINSKCPKCKSENITGILMSKESTENDPNIVCNDCHYVWD